MKKKGLIRRLNQASRLPSTSPCQREALNAMIRNWMALLLPQRKDYLIHPYSCLVIILHTLRGLVLEGKERSVGSGSDLRTNQVTD